MTYTWALPGRRPLVKHESNRGQRVNVLAALAASGTTPQEPLCWQTAARTWKSEDVKAFLQDRLPGTAGPPLTRVFPKWESVAAAGSVCLPRVGLGQARRERLSPVV